MVLLKAAYADVVWIASHTVNKDAKEAQQELMCAKEHLAIAIDIARLEQ